jgi:hypothetical protein
VADDKSAAARWCDPFSRNRRKPGDGRLRSLVNVASNGGQIHRELGQLCIHVGAMCQPNLHRNRENINSDHSRCQGVSTILRQTAGHQMSEARTERR